tara:strand:- start:3894 stop:4196 length:303 start_codon:yes stop_codon:yes gene_type:complete
MKNRPPLSIPVAGSSIVPIMVFSCGHEHYSQEGIMSALQQTFNKIEFLVFVDEPQDNSAAIISALPKKYNFFFGSQQGMGLPAAAKQGAVCGQRRTFCFI